MFMLLLSHQKWHHFPKKDVMKEITLGNWSKIVDRMYNSEGIRKNPYKFIWLEIKIHEKQISDK